MSEIQGPVLVVGYGKSGRGAAWALATRGVEVIAIDENPDVASNVEKELSDGLSAVDVRIASDAEDMARLALDAGANLAVVSPGVAPHTPVRQALTRADI